MSDTDLIKKSVTAGDYAPNPYAGPSGLMFFYPTAYSGPQYAPLPAWWSVRRDFALRATVHRESMWASAIYKAITKTAALGWEIQDSTDSKLRTKRGQDIYLTALAGMHRGWVPFVSMHLRDYLLTDNDAFVEIIRASSAAGSRIMGIAHLDGARCTRTGDADIPVLYSDRLGKLHEMKWYQVMSFADMPDPSETWNGVGLCAASRAFLTIAKLAALEQYVYEKAAGDGATELTFIKGISASSMESAILTADGEQKRKGAAYYKGKIVVPVMGDTSLEEVTIPLKNVPDGFDAKQERDNAYVIYANAIGVPVQDIQPLSGQGLGTGAQTIVLAEDAEGMGLASWRNDWNHKQNEYILPDTTTFSWSNRHDTRDQKADAEVKNLYADAILKLVGNPTAPGVVTNAQGLNLAVDWSVVPAEYMPSSEDATPGGVLGDDDKPTAPVQLTLPLVTPPAPVAPVPAAPVTKAQRRANRQRWDGHQWVPDPPVTKVTKDTDVAALIDDQLDAALALVSRVLGKESA